MSMPYLLKLDSIVNWNSLIQTMPGRLFKSVSNMFVRRVKRRKPLAKVPDIKNKRFLFIGGLHRSGTSILHRLLCEHPMTSGFHDTGVPEDEGQHLQTVFSPAHEYGGPGEFAFHPDAHLTEDSSLISPENRDRLLMEWGAYYDLDKPVWLEKSPPNLIRSRFFRAIFPGSRFLFIVRHPIAVSLATEKWSDRTINERLLHWNMAYSLMFDDIEDENDCLVIRYEDFVARPELMLNEVCQLIGIGSFAPAEVVENHNEKYFSDWQQRYASQIGALQAVLPSNGSLLDKFGYSLTTPYVAQR